MLKWAIVFALLSLFFGVLGFGNLASGFAVIAKILFGIFLVGLVIVILIGAGIFRAAT